MPNRYLRQSYVESESVNLVGWQAEVVWLRLLVTVDDWGRTEANVKLLRPKLFPLKLDLVREADLERWLAECEIAVLLRFYDHGGKRFLQMMKWEKGRAETSKFPDPPPEIANTCFLPPTDANGRKRQKADVPDPDSGTGSGSDNGTDPDPDLALRIGGWFGRKKTTAWSVKERKSFRLVESMQTPAEDIDLLELFYKADIAKDKDYRRHDILTLLNNWNGEIDRARRWKGGNQSTGRRDIAV